MNTASAIPLDDFPLEEKLALMERLWESLAKKPDAIPTPDWHGDVLAEREAAVREGRTQFVDWEETKQRLRDRFK
jgi:putative addiction module component (TIGR02574 family)